MSKFIVVEGVDGCGKTTLMKGIEVALVARGEEVVTTREPGGSPKAEEIRQFLLSDDGAKLTLTEQLELFHKARLDHIETVIKPALKRGAVVISDRFELSSWVYQVCPNQENLEYLFKQCTKEVEQALETFVPHYFVLQLDAESARSRLLASKEINHLDATRYDDIKDRLDAYKVADKKVRGVFEYLDATGSPDEILATALKKIQ